MSSPEFACGCGSAARVRFAIVTVETGIEIDGQGAFLGCSSASCPRRTRAQRKAQNRAALLLPEGSAEARIVAISTATPKARSCPAESVAAT